MLPPTPPPDIDLEIWRDSLARIARVAAGHALLTHFGPSTPSAAHLTELSEHLELVSGLAQGVAHARGQRREREAWFTDEVRRELRRRMSDADAHAYEIAGRFDLNWRGLARYWRKRERRVT